MNGKGRIVGLVGPPGIGKSRLAAEISFAGRAPTVYRSSPLRANRTPSDLPFHVATRLLRELLAIGTGGGRSACRCPGPDARAWTRKTLLLLEDLLGIRDEQTTLPAIDPDARRRRLSAMLNAAVVARNDARPCT